MNKKGQMMDGTMGLMIVVFVVVIVGLAIFVQVAQDVGTITNTRTITNLAFTVPAASTATALTGQAASSFAMMVHNGSGHNLTLVATNYTVADHQVLNGVYTATITMADGNYEGNSSWLNYTAEPDGYLENSGARGIAPLIIILSALGIGIIVLVPTIRSRVLEMMGR